MKKAWLAALCSGLVIPGLGQVFNQHLKKGLILLGSVFVLFLAALFASYRVIQQAMESAPDPSTAGGGFIARLQAQDLTALKVILALFAILWIYAVIDAFVSGARIDRGTR